MLEFEPTAWGVTCTMASVLRRLFVSDCLKRTCRLGNCARMGSKIPLQGQPFQVCAILLSHAGELVSREELRQQVWPEDTFVDFDHALNTAITKIRMALGDQADNPRFVETLPRRGYRFIAPVDKAISAPEPVPTPPQRCRRRSQDERAVGLSLQHWCLVVTLRSWNLAVFP